MHIYLLPLHGVIKYQFIKIEYQYIKTILKYQWTKTIKNIFYYFYLLIFYLQRKQDNNYGKNDTQTGTAAAGG